VWLLAWYPLEAGTLGRPRGQLARIAANAGCTAAQLTLSACFEYESRRVINPGYYKSGLICARNREAEFQIYDDEIVARYQDAIQRLRALREAAGSFRSIGDCYSSACGDVYVDHGDHDWIVGL